jgi:hypothetical protein
MKRYDLINKLIKENNFKNYLEIGVCDPRTCFDIIECENKDSVDPGIEFEENPVDYKMTSDEFFDWLDNNNPNRKYDVIFIDGLHLSWQVKNDIENSLRYLSDNGYIILHDCNPPDIFHSRENYATTDHGSCMPGEFIFNWNGTVWKALYDVRTNRKDLHCCTIDTDWGLGVIRKNLNNNTELIPHHNYFYEYNKMQLNRNKDLGLISVEEITNWIKNTNE